MKALVGAFNQEKALVGAFSVIIQLPRLIDLRHYIQKQVMITGTPFNTEIIRNDFLFNNCTKDAIQELHLNKWSLEKISEVFIQTQV